MFRRRAPASKDAAERAPRATLWPAVFCVLAGFANLLAFEPFGWWPIQLLAFAFLFYQVGLDLRVRRSAVLGWAFGFGWSVAGMHWLFVAMHRYGGMPAPMAALAVCLLASYMALFAALATGSASWLRRRLALPVPAFLLLVLPSAWAVTEWMRGWVFTGFPWAASGYAHTDSPLAGYAPLLGVYGIGLVAALGGASLTLLTQRARWKAVGLLALLLAVGAGLRAVEWTRPVGQPLSVRLLQGNVPQDQKFARENLVNTLQLYRQMIIEKPADLIATPETAIPILPVYLPSDYLGGLSAFAKSSGSSLIVGIPLGEDFSTAANSVAGFSPGGAQYRYDKHHLVPFGEFIPPGFRWFVDMMRIPLGDFQRGAPVQTAMEVKGQRVLPNVCYEDAFGEEIALQLRSASEPATILLNVSNLAWYGQSVAIPQHLQISRMRSLETGRPMLRATNTGATAIIDGRGQVQAQLPQDTRNALEGRVQGMGGLTPYVRAGNLLFLALSALAVAAAWAMARRRPPRED
jgi:apolipoprotein N-acyltransferase